MVKRLKSLTEFSIFMFHMNLPIRPVYLREKPIRVSQHAVRLNDIEYFVSTIFLGEPYEKGLIETMGFRKDTKRKDDLSSFEQLRTCSRLEAYRNHYSTLFEAIKLATAEKMRIFYEKFKSHIY